jgi:hypothetical protein
MVALLGERRMAVLHNKGAAPCGICCSLMVSRSLRWYLSLSVVEQRHQA